jgi:hypothetical protein
VTPFAALLFVVEKPFEIIIPGYYYIKV